ncbi:phosphoribulokinase [uncultured Lentibacter sp.]|uniref:phosphoribulokinase n=1 Tax=uncultured Lentibacter sp. TaxID=1659309 RepID=UPI00262F5C1B|nr:phosphoribulokinase [uncultured Lentibacter sp.]
MDITKLLELITTRAKGRMRCLVAIAGPPASGKTTLASALAARLGPVASVLPMDGFHLDNTELRARGLLERKGAPETFDAQGFAELLARVRTEPELQFPTFDRQADCTRPDAGQLSAHTRIVLVEGNYLLLRSPPWDSLETLFDMTVALEVARDTLERRLLARWLQHGLSPQDARARVLNNDMKNADFVTQNARPAEIVLPPKH